MDALTESFDERIEEIESYLELLAGLEKQAQLGGPKLGSTPITPQQQKILYSAVYLQLYNLVESTMTRCVEAVCRAAAVGPWRPGDWSAPLRREWVRTAARTHDDLNNENRLNFAAELCETLVTARPIPPWVIEKGGGGNWDDNKIEAMTKRLGVELRISRDVFSRIKQPVRDEMGPLALVKTLRNNLAHGNISFAECSESVTVSDLQRLKEQIVLYLREVLLTFKSFIGKHEFLHPERRP